MRYRPHREASVSTSQGGVALAAARTPEILGAAARHDRRTHTCAAGKLGEVFEMHLVVLLQFQHRHAQREVKDKNNIRRVGANRRPK